MKNFLQTTLIGFSMALCALIAFQWVRETELRKHVQDLTNKVQDRSERILNLEAVVRRGEEDIKRLDALKNQLTDLVKSNNLQIGALSKDLEQATTEVDRLNEQVDKYKEAIKQANENIIAQNDVIKNQNEQMKTLAEQRNEMVQKFNNMAKEYNALADKWNKQQEELMKAATNAPAAPKPSAPQRK